MKRGLVFELARVTENAALAVEPLIGSGDKIAIDQAAVDAIRSTFNGINIKGRVVIGEGKKDKAPMLYTGEEVGCGSDCKVDIAVDPVEGTTLVANGFANAIAVIAIAPEGNLFTAPDMYMEKIATGREAKGVIDLDATPTENIKAVAQAKGKSISEMRVVLLDRPRNEEIITEVRQLGVKVKLIDNGDVIAGISTAMNDIDVDLLLGIGGAPEGVLTAAALQCLGGDMQARLCPYNQSDIDEVKSMGITLPLQKLTIDQLAGQDDIIFAATGITAGLLLEGVSSFSEELQTHSIVMHKATGTIKDIKVRNQRREVS